LFLLDSELQCDTLLERCRGFDSLRVIDDEGGATRTVSVEDSFRRGTVKFIVVVWKNLDSFFVRLLQLLSDRLAYSPNPKLAYPSTLRLTVRLLDPSLQHLRRPYVTRSKQVGIQGEMLMSEAANEGGQVLLLKQWVTPLVEHMFVDHRDAVELDVTRMNLAVTNFADVASRSNNYALETVTLASPFQQKYQSNTNSLPSRSSFSPPAKRHKSKATVTTRIDHFFCKKG
jgi:hypothetical protein